ncbi:MAG: transglutaminase N-terminal domain-containing protein, partial [Rhodomicrobium sp.]
MTDTSLTSAPKKPIQTKLWRGTIAARVCRSFKGSEMRFSVCHEKHYRYSAPVLFAPHVLRLTPRSDNAVLLTHSLTVDPAPTIRQDVTDRHGNTITRVEFGDPSGHLGIESRFELETRATPALV